MKYLESALIVNIDKSCIALHQVKFIRWGVTSLYLSLLLVCYTLIMYSFPGYEVEGSMDAYAEWYYETFYTINIPVQISWLALSFISTYVSIFSISKIVRALKYLQV